MTVAAKGSEPAGGPEGPALPKDGVVRVFREKGGRGGKTVTVVRGLEGDLAAVAGDLKRHCGTGGVGQGRRRSRSRVTTATRSSPACSRRATGQSSPAARLGDAIQPRVGSRHAATGSGRYRRDGLLARGRLHDDRGRDDRAADERRRARPLGVREPHPQRPEHHLEQRQQRDLGRREQPRADREEREPESHLEVPSAKKMLPVRRASPTRTKRTAPTTTTTSACEAHVAGIIETSRRYRVITITIANDAVITIGSTTASGTRVERAGHHHA